MKLIISEMASDSIQHGREVAEQLGTKLNAIIENYTDDFVQDMSHISQAANYSGHIRVDQVLHIKDNLYRCDYSYDWAIAWTCSGTQESGRVSEKVRFTIEPNGEVEFKFLTFE